MRFERILFLSLPVIVGVGVLAVLSGCDGDKAAPTAWLLPSPKSAPATQAASSANVTAAGHAVAPVAIASAASGPAAAAVEKAVPAAPVAVRPLSYHKLYDPFVPIAWHSLPEGAPLKRLIKQTRLPRPAEMPVNATPADVAQAQREAAAQLPAAFSEQARTVAENMDGNRELGEIQDRFIEEVSKLPDTPSEFTYQQDWKKAQFEANEQFIAMFGMAAFEAQQQVVTKNP